MAKLEYTWHYKFVFVVFYISSLTEKEMDAVVEEDLATCWLKIQNKQAFTIKFTVVDV